jgi:hypothetical protein
VELVPAFLPSYLTQAGPAAFPMWVDTPWTQPERGKNRAVVAIPPIFSEIVGPVDVRIHDADGKIVKTLPAEVESFGPEGLQFKRAVASWSLDDFAPNTYFVTARVSARTLKPMLTVTPRMVTEGILSGR